MGCGVSTEQRLAEMEMVWQKRLREELEFRQATQREYEARLQQADEKIASTDEKLSAAEKRIEMLGEETSGAISHRDETINSLEASLRSTRHEHELEMESAMELLEEHRQLLAAERQKLQETIGAKSELEARLRGMDLDIAHKQDELVQLTHATQTQIQALRAALEAELEQKKLVIEEQTQQLGVAHDTMQQCIDALNTEILQEHEMDEEILAQLSQTHRDAVLLVRKHRRQLAGLSDSLRNTEQSAGDLREQNAQQQDTLLRQQERILTVENRHEKLRATLTNPQTRLALTIVKSLRRPSAVAQL